MPSRLVAYRPVPCRTEAHQTSQVDRRTPTIPYPCLPFSYRSPYRPLPSLRTVPYRPTLPSYPTEAVSAQAHQLIVVPRPYPTPALPFSYRPPYRPPYRPRTVHVPSPTVLPYPTAPVSAQAHQTSQIDRDGGVG